MSRPTREEGSAPSVPTRSASTSSKRALVRARIEELSCRSKRAVRAEIIVARLGKPHEAFGCLDQRIEPLAERDRDHGVALAVQDQHRRRHFADAQIRAKRILDQ